MTRINTNTAALLAKAYGQKANAKMLTPMERLSTGERINSAADDAAGLAVGNKMLNSIKSYDQGVRNSTDMISLLSTAESSLQQITNMQLRLRELAVQSSNGIYTNSDRDKMEEELLELVSGIDHVSDNTKFNNVYLLNGSYTGQTIQTGKDTGSHVSINLATFNTQQIGRYWETSSFDNGNFEGSQDITSLGSDVYSIEGWNIYNRRVELGEDGARGPTSITDRDGAALSNLVGGYRTPADPTPRPFNNDIATRDINYPGGIGGTPAPNSELPGTDDSSRPSDYGTLENDSQKGFEFADGALKLYGTGLTSQYGMDVVHGSYIVSSTAKSISAGDKVKFDYKSEGVSDASDVFAYVLNVDTGDTQVILDYTQAAQAAEPFRTAEVEITTTGNYKFVFINGTFDATGGQALGAAMSIDNIEIVRRKLPADQQHLVSQISVQTVAEAENAINVLDHAISQTSSVRAQLGALINRLHSSIQTSSSMGNDMRVARSRIMDAEYTIETSRLAKFQILANASNAMLAQANASKNTVLELIR